ncbi:MAG: chromate transporter [Dysosmobacter sp.]|nr:chromate transporter [Dysosmobacter sp.]
MIYLQLYWEFFKTGLFAVGGGMATLPFLQAIGESTGWYTYTDLMNMLAVSESTPGPIGINMATYVGFTAAGIPGAVIATIGEVTPSIIVILIVAAVLHSFRNNKYVDQAFYGLRPASTGLIGAACVAVILEVLTSVQLITQESGILKIATVSLVAGEPLGGLLNLSGLALASLLLVLTNWVPKVKGLHPIAFIGLSAAVGIVFDFAGV